MEQKIITLSQLEKKRCKLCKEITFVNTNKLCSKCYDKDKCVCGNLKGKKSRFCSRCSILNRWRKR